MKFLPYLGFALIALTAIAFAAWPVFKAAESRKARALLAGAIAFFVLGIGGGIYWIVGQPHLALREAQGLLPAGQNKDLNGLAPLLIKRVRAHPDDEQGWMYLAQVYATAGDADDAAGALGRAVLAARQHKTETPQLDLAYGEMLSQAAGGQIPPGARGAFAAALAQDPKNVPARYYLGLAAAQAGDRANAARYWQGLLDEVPANLPLHQELIDRMASIGAAPPGIAGQGGAPDISAMVAKQAAELKASPNNPAGWLRLIRAYSVLGDKDKAKDALATARKAVGTDASVKAALDQEAAELKLD